MSDTRCGRVEPSWVKLGTIKWQGSPAPEPHYMIEYHRCKREGTLGEVGGIRAYLCVEHITPSKPSIEDPRAPEKGILRD